MSKHAPLKLDYLEFASPALEDSQTFFANAFGWEFISYGEDYRDIQKAGLGGGIERADLRPPLPVLKTDDLEAAYARMIAAGAKITKEIFDFPGGQRFQFTEPGGTEMAIWAEPKSE